MKEKRFSNKLKQKQLETKSLEEQTKKMEDKLAVLKKQIQEQKQMRTELGLDSTLTRWQKTNKASGPLKSYAKQVLEEQKQAYNHFGISQKKITGTKTFQNVLKKIKHDKDEEEQRNPTKITTFLNQQEKTQQEATQKVPLSDNFFKAKMNVAQLIKQKTLQQFLEQNFILEYLAVFQGEGVTDLESLRYVTREKLAELGVKAGHQVKIIKRIKEQFDRMLRGKAGQQKKEANYKPEKVESGYGEGDVQDYEALNAEKQETASPSLESVAPLEEGNSKPPFEDDDNFEDEEQDEVLITVPVQEMALQVSSEQSRVNCYECYRSILSPTFQYDQKYFCTELCMEKYLVGLRKNCPSCGKTFIKTEGYREQGLWFCCLGCCPNHQEIEQIFFQWHKQGS